MIRSLVLLIACGLLVSEAAPLTPQQVVSPEVQTLYEQARSAQQANRTTDAIADYQKILRLAPDLARPITTSVDSSITSVVTPKPPSLSRTVLPLRRTCIWLR